MESTIVRNSDTERITMAGVDIKYREAVRKQLNDEVKKIINVEILNAGLEIMQEHKKATRKIIEDFRSTIRQVVEEEKVDIRRKAETLKKSILYFGP